MDEKRGKAGQEQPGEQVHTTRALAGKKYADLEDDQERDQDVVKVLARRECVRVNVLQYTNARKSADPCQRPPPVAHRRVKETVDAPRWR